MAGTIVADTLTHSTAGSIATNYVVNGSAKAWAFATSAAALTGETFNISSGLDNGTGDYTLSLSNSISSNDSVFSGTVGNSTAQILSVASRTTSSYDAHTFNASGSATDNTTMTLVHGDLA